MPHFNFVTKAVLVSIILLMTIIGGLSIWLSRAPLDLAKIKPYIEDKINDSITDYTVEIGSLRLSWPAINEPILFDMAQVTITQNVAEMPSQSVIENINIGLSARHLLIGKALPSVVIIEDPVLNLVKQGGRYNLDWQGISQSQAQTPDIKLNQNKTIFDPLFSTDKGEYNFLSALRQVELRRAVIKSEDMTSQETDYLALADIALKKNPMGLNGDLTLTLPGAEGRNAVLTSDVAYRRAEKDIILNTTVRDLNPAQFTLLFPNLEILKGQDLNIGGQVKANFTDQISLQNAFIDFQIPQGKVTIRDVYDEGLSLNDIMFEAYFDRPQSKLDITKFTANVGNIPLEITGTSEAEGQNIKLPLTLSIAETSMDNVAKIFPKSHIESSAGQWITKRLSEGTLRNIELRTDFHLIHDSETSSYDGKMTNVTARFDSENMTVQYSDTLKPVKNTTASGLYEDDTLTITGQSGMIGDVKGSDVNLRLTNLSVAGGGMAYLSLNASGPFRSVLDYVADEPIAANDLGFDSKAVEGKANFKLDLEFPTLKNLPKEEVIVKVDGTLTDVLIPNVVRGLPLSGGPYALKFKDGLISLGGKGQLAGRNIDLTWQEYFDPTGKEFSSKITAKLIADEGLRKAFNIGLEEYVSGPIPVDVTYIDRGVPATVKVKGDLTPATLNIEPFNYQKAAGQAGSLSLTASLQNDTLKEISGLQVSADKFNLKDGRLIFRKLKDGSDDVARGSISEATLDRTKLKVDFEITEQNVLKVVAKGPTLELKPFVNSDQKDQSANDAEWQNPEVTEERPMQISVEADRLLAEKDQVLTGTKLYVELDKQSDVTRLEMDANVGAGAMFIRFRPDGVTNKRTFRLESTDAGATLKVFGLYDEIKGGALLVYGEPRQGDNEGNLFGKAQITDFSVSEAPVLAKLLGAMSQSGVQNALQNNDLSFAKLESDFEWQFREGANLLVMKNGRTSGSSLGLTFEGVFNQGKSTIDVSGTVIPLSGVNNVVGNIPVIGQILTGGKALLAATYGVKGASSDPKVTINPLSVLAPGFLRSILFEESVDRKIENAQ